MKHLHFSLVLCLAAGAAAQVTLNPVPTRIIGQPNLVVNTLAPNYVEGRELSNPNGIALDTTTNPPILYVADTGNNRVLAWRDAKSANGSFADVVIGQRDMLSTLPLGPGTGTTSGLAAPTGLAVDRSGNLWVVDSGSNRILRFPKPFDQPDPFKQPDLVIGQKNLNSRAANQGEISPNERTLFTSTVQTGTLRAALSFDAQGNLWAVDPGNNRVLRYPASRLTGNEAAADIVIGQFDFATRTGLTGAQQDFVRKNAFGLPDGIFVDDSGRLFVSDGLHRVLVFLPPLRSGQDAARILGIPKQSPPGQPAPPPINDTTLFQPGGIFSVGNTPWVVDTGNSRLLRFAPVGEWAPETTLNFSPGATFVLGQLDMQSRGLNRGQRLPSDSSFAGPGGAAFGGGDLYVADSVNNRVLIFPQPSPGAFANASRVQGQIGFVTNAPNLVESKGLWTFANYVTISGVPARFSNSAGIVVDYKSDPPRLYIADTFNNRVLGYADARRVRPGDPADLVIGQPDFFRAAINNPTGDPDALNDSGLFNPTGLAVDSTGNLFVADSRNSRVLRFPSPFGQASGTIQRANLVLGQASFFSKITDATNRSMSSPHGLAFTPDGHLLVSDRIHNRVLLFRKPSGGDFSNGMAASNVFGQPDFQSFIGSNASNRMISPLHIAADTDARLYVADTGNNRILIYNTVTNAGTDPGPVITLTAVANTGDRLNSPHGIYVSERTGEIWVADTGNRRVVRYSNFDRLLQTSLLANAGFLVQDPLAVAQDAFGNLFIADAANRVAIHFPTFRGVKNGASFLNRPVSPGMWVTLQGSFGETTMVFNEVPNPVPMTRELADLQVLINDRPVPLHFVSPEQINFYMPMDAPTSGTVETQVVRRSTGQLLAAGTLQMGEVTPALFTATGQGSGQVSALNQDNSINSATNPITRGQVLQLFGTGQGFVAGAPDDGDVSSGLKPTSEKPRIFIGTDREVDQADIQYSGLAPGSIGLWQINVKIPDFVAPGNAVPIGLILRGVPSTLGVDGGAVRTTIAVKAQ